MLSESFIKTVKIVGDIDNVLKLIYKTRETSIFYKQSEVKVPLYFDINQPMVALPATSNKMPEKINLIMKDLSLSNRYIFSPKIKSYINTIHSLLDHRDNLFLSVSGLICKISNIFNSNAKKISSIVMDDLPFYEYDELKKLFKEDYKSDLSNVIRFRKWQSARFKAQLVPKMIYEKDIENLYLISNKLLGKFVDKKSIPCTSFFHSEIKEGDGYIFNGNRLCNKKSVILGGLPVSKFHLLENVETVITDKTSIFSYLTEYATIMGLSLYSGVPFATALLKGKHYTLNKDKIILQ